MELAGRAGRSLDDSQIAAADRFIALLLEQNVKMNLTRISDRAAAEVQHVGDALTLLPYIPTGEIRLADIGSGGGVPGIPLAIALPPARIILVESTGKKARFLQHVVDELKLSNVRVISDRAEKIARTSDRASFDIVTARAVGAINWLAEWCLPLTKVGGKVLAMKGARAEGELVEAANAIRLLGGGPPKVHPVDLPGTEHHVIVEIEKTAETDGKYPRNPTTTRGKPIA